MSTCLITGGAGFIGCALSSILPDHFDRVVAIDNLHPQVHPSRDRPADLDPRVELVIGDVTSAADWDALLADVDPTAVIHLAAETGTGQSLTEATRHAKVNVVGTTELLDALVRHAVDGRSLPERIVLTSSRAVYGEGAWTDADGHEVYPGQRSRAMLESGTWDFPGLTATPFNSHRVIPTPTSVYGSTKLAQENILTSWCLAMNVTPVLFRLQNVYGPGQSLINPYTGIVSFFAQRAQGRRGHPGLRGRRDHPRLRVHRRRRERPGGRHPVVAGDHPAVRHRLRRGDQHPATGRDHRRPLRRAGAADQREVPGRRRPARLLHHRGIDRRPRMGAPGHGRGRHPAAVPLDRRAGRRSGRPLLTPVRPAGLRRFETSKRRFPATLERVTGNRRLRRSAEGQTLLQPSRVLAPPLIEIEKTHAVTAPPPWATVALKPCVPVIPKTPLTSLRCTLLVTWATPAPLR